MTRVRYAPARKKKKKKLFKLMKGAVGGRRKLLRTAKETAKRALKYSYRDRKVKKRTMRGLWIARINAAVKERGFSYSRFIAGLKAAKINLDRKILADLAISDKATFDAIADLAMKK